MFSNLMYDEFHGNCCFAVIFGFSSVRRDVDEDQFKDHLMDIRMEEYGGVICSLNPFQVEAWEQFLLHQGFKPIINSCFNPHTFNHVRMYVLDWDLEEEYRRRAADGEVDYYDDDAEYTVNPMPPVQPLGKLAPATKSTKAQKRDAQKRNALNNW